MTKYSDATARAKFDACGYGETCEFVGLSGKRFIARCRECGHEFTRENKILREPQKKLRCPECHERKVSAMLEWYQACHSQKECAEKFGMTVAQVCNYAQARGVHGGLPKNTSSRSNLNKASEANIRRAGERVRKRVLSHGFTMLDEWIGQDATYRVRCNRCGAEQELTSFTLRNCKFACPECERFYKAMLAEVRAEWSLISKEISRANREAKLILDRLDRWTGKLDEYLPIVTTCHHCGRKWTHWPWWGRYEHRAAPRYCTRRCQRKANKEPSNTGHRLRKYRSSDKPREKIKLRDLYERDGGVCQICGELTDFDDYTRKDDGSFWYINGKYPTRDHIVPLAKGGTHTWDNVQLACRDCNSAKSDKLLTRG